MSWWVVPTIDEQWAHLRKIRAIRPANETSNLRCRVRFLTSNFEWEVAGVSKMGENGASLNVHLISPKSLRRRTAWPWELRAVA